MEALGPQRRWNVQDPVNGQIHGQQPEKGWSLKGHPKSISKTMAYWSLPVQEAPLLHAFHLALHNSVSGLENIHLKRRKALKPEFLENQSIRLLELCIGKCETLKEDIPTFRSYVDSLASYQRTGPALGAVGAKVGHSHRAHHPP